MRSITLKLTLAFLLIGLTGSILVAVLIRQRTRAAFNEFVVNRDQQALVDDLVQYYQENGSWSGIGASLLVKGAELPRAQEEVRDARPEWMRFILVGPDRTVVFSGRPNQIGRKVANRELDRAVPLKADGEVAGWLIPAQSPRDWIPDSAEGLFLRDVNRAALISALVAAGLALSLGGLLAFTLTRSLRELREATVEIAQGKLGGQVKVRSQDELGELAESFNKMSLDLAKATRARRQMTADIAHDLRSPLSVISGYSEALSEGKLQGSPEIFTILHRESGHLSRLIEDLRTLSLADAGELTLNLQPVAPRALLDRVAANYAFTAQQKGVSLRIEVVEAPARLLVDPERIHQVLDNLVYNAFRHTSSGGEVLLTAGSLDGAVRLQVRDTGAGIASEDLPYIFDRFYRGDKSRHQAGASGLGLAIAKSIVELHRGTISVDSSPGQGATFTITLPVAPANEGSN